MLLLTPGCGSTDVPQYVKGPVSGFVYNCEEEKQKAPAPADYLTSGELDGDGLPDFIIDSGKGCAANRALYCNDEGCTIDTYLSSLSGLGGTFKARTFRIGKHGEKPALFVTRGGGACGKPAAQECSAIYVFDGEQLVIAP